MRPRPLADPAMAGATVYKDVAEDMESGSSAKLFAGKKFWVAQRVPIRNHIINDIKSNGGEIVILEKNADYLIADRFRRDCPPGSISYEFIEQSIKQGALADPDDHPAGRPVGEAREAGAIHQPARTRRAAYTAEEDRILYNWVRDKQSKGTYESGNEIYKELEQKCPRHTWQSWRDRWLKKLRDLPASAFNVPDDDASPAPASGPSNERAPPAVPKEAPKTKQPTPVPAPASASTTKASVKTEKYDYSVGELTDMFTAENWSELYGNVDLIDDTKADSRYDLCWDGWAEAQGDQTAEQWRQYYEKVVRPQWLRDPQSKRDEIRKERERKHAEEEPSQSQSVREQFEDHEKIEHEAVAAHTPTVDKGKAVHKPSKFEDEQFEILLEVVATDKFLIPYTFYARKMKYATWAEQPSLDYAALHELLFTQWYSLSEEEKAPYIAMDQGLAEIAPDTPKDTTKIARGSKVASSSTARPESPEAYTKLHQKFVKRLRDDSEEEEEQDHVQVPRPSKRRKSASATPTMDDKFGTQYQPLEISSAASSQSLLDDEEDEEATMVEHTVEDEDKDLESIASTDIEELPPPHPAIQHFPTTTTTTTTSPQTPPPHVPSATKPKTKNSAAPPPSSNSTQTPTPQQPTPSKNFANPSKPKKKTQPTPSSPPNQHPFNARGIEDAFIDKALVRTRLRPDLAIKVIDAWTLGQSLPIERGIWSKQDDEDVESGDGVALARLERKHTLDGWGGITERLVFLEECRSRRKG
ncbi:transcription factor [Pyrenophora seminiperda CCB06]|uniref:DNA-binding protein RAP1 n=1 Tax=Pyrenophora seminiperda CCB06 TaxID=1302712 RepID=A0A3M7M2J4_9PLEO|nr:transcription factor [Pyrenophora seminiperda CCB06]